jgi:D-alanyl-lipoteichoic acid acyltransferase DltB (MBOAT superfamily)
MLFNSWGYLLFLLLVLPLYGWIGSPKLRLWLLVAASVGFYSMWRWEFSLLVLFSACVDFVAARRIAASGHPRRRRAWLLASLTINLGLLAAFKYTYFVYDNVRLLVGAAGAELPASADLGLRIVLPLGISFYTFQTISYSIDVYRRVIEPTRNLASFLCYVTFWPQLIAGPVLRAGEVIPQLEASRRLRGADLWQGLALVVVGLFKKVVIADGLAPLVDRAFALDPASLTALDVWVATFLFGFQIYFDFAGYSDIAIGSARMLGLHFPKNFDWPYLARSPREFWTRWHISLSSWIRDYLYAPLTGRRFHSGSQGGIGEAAGADPGRRHSALLATWLLMGLWHGAAWTFAVWGLYHAALIGLYRALPPLAALPERHPRLAWALLLPLAMAGWIPFRAQSLEQAGVLFATLLDPGAYGMAGHAVPLGGYLWAGLVLLGMLAVHGLARLDRARGFPAWLRTAAATAATALMVCAVLVCLRAAQQFIYFQF